MHVTCTCTCACTCASHVCTCSCNAHVYMTCTCTCASACHVTCACMCMYPPRSAPIHPAAHTQTKPLWSRFFSALFAFVPGALRLPLPTTPAVASSWLALRAFPLHPRRNAATPLRALRPLESATGCLALGQPPCMHNIGVSGATDAPLVVAWSPEHTEASLDELHNLYQCIKVDTLGWPELLPLATLLFALCAHTGRWPHVFHYACDFASLGSYLNILAQPAAAPRPGCRLAARGTPFCIIAWLSTTLDSRPALPFHTHGSSFASLPASPALCFPMPAGGADSSHHGRQCCMQSTLAQNILQLFAILNACSSRRPICAKDARLAHSKHIFYERLVSAMVMCNFGAKQLEALPLGLALPLQDAIRACRQRCPEYWGVRAFNLIGREDMAVQLTTATATQPSAISLPLIPHASYAPGQDVDGMGVVVRGSGLVFSADLRLIEVRRLLCSSRPLTLRLGSGSPELSDHDLIHEKQARLRLMCRRSMALPVGRGMFSLASASPQLTEVMRLAPLALKGQIPSNSATVDMDVSALPADHLAWPEFHNGAAAALRLCPPGCGTNDEGKLGRNWIVYNKPRSRQYEHAGFLLGLGLQGHLLALANTDLYRCCLLCELPWLPFVLSLRRCVTQVHGAGPRCHHDGRADWHGGRATRLNAQLDCKNALPTHPSTPSADVYGTRARGALHRADCGASGCWPALPGLGTPPLHRGDAWRDRSPPD